MRDARRIPLCDYPARRIALIKPSALGDIIHSLPVLTALRRRYPEAHITWIVNRGYAPLLNGHPDLDAVLPFERGAFRASWPRGLVSYGRFLQTCRRQAFDLVVDLQGLLRTGLMTACSGACRKVGLSSAREGAVWFYTDVVRVADCAAIHAVDRYWLAAEALGAGDGPKEFRVPVAEAERCWALDLLQQYPRPWLALAVGARWVTKRWPPEHFAVLVQRVQQRFGGTAFFVGSSDEAKLSQTAAGFLHGGPFCDLTGKTTLPQLAALLAQADVMLANDTGPLHLAAALGRPVVSPYTCTKVLRSGPYGSQAAAVEADIWCQGSYLKRCPRLECMAKLTPDHLWPALSRTLQQWEGQRDSRDSA